MSSIVSVPRTVNSVWYDVVNIALVLFCSSIDRFECVRDSVQTRPRLVGTTSED